MSKLKLDLHDIYNRSSAIDHELQRVIHEAVEKKICEVEIISGRGSGQLRKRVLRFLQRADIKPLYHRVVKESRNPGRLFVYFRF